MSPLPKQLTLSVVGLKLNRKNNCCSFFILVADPSPICKVVQMLDRKVKMCLKLKKVSLALSNTGACMDVSIGKLERPLGCFYISK